MQPVTHHSWGGGGGCVAGSAPQAAAALGLERGLGWVDGLEPKEPTRCVLMCDDGRSVGGTTHEASKRSIQSSSSGDASRA